jgi:endonuclease/exonuclease/phosphatase family metal-dependent hydrolase
MTGVLSWNIQTGKGVDGEIRIDRIARIISQLGDPDVICLQEVSRNLPLIAGIEPTDQVAELAALFPRHTPVFGAAVQTANWAFGNLTLTRLPLHSVVLHPLPQPKVPGIRHMQRQATELNLQAGKRIVRVTNTHLEYHSALQRLAQVGRLLDIHAEIAENRHEPPAYTPSGPYSDVGRAEHAVLCGDFNMTLHSREYREVLERSSPRLIDVWTRLNPGLEHPPTCGVFDHAQWPEGAHCRDFFFVTDAIAQTMRAMRVDTSTDASDHQPLMIEF